MSRTPHFVPCAGHTCVAGSSGHCWAQNLDHLGAGILGLEVRWQTSAI